MEWDLGLGISVVERLHPLESGQLSRDPPYTAWTSGNALNRDVFFQRQACDFVLQLPGAVPDFHFFGEALVGKQIRVRTVKLGRENVLAVRREIDRDENRRLANGGCAAIGSVDQQQLRGCVVVKEIFVMRVLQKVFERGCRSLLAVALLNDGTVWNFAFDRRIAALGGYGLHQKSVSVGHPLQRVADDRADFHARNAVRGCGSRLADPEFNSILRSIGEGEALAVRRPLESADIGVARQFNVALLAVGDADQMQSDNPWRMVPAVRRRINAYSGQPKHRLRQVGDWRISQPVTEQHHVGIGTNYRQRSRLRAQYL